MSSLPSQQHGTCVCRGTQLELDTSEATCTAAPASVLNLPRQATAPPGSCLHVSIAAACMFQLTDLAAFAHVLAGLWVCDVSGCRHV